MQFGCWVWRCVIHSIIAHAHSQQHMDQGLTELYAEGPWQRGEQGKVVIIIDYRINNIRKTTENDADGIDNIVIKILFLISNYNVLDWIHISIIIFQWCDSIQSKKIALNVTWGAFINWGNVGNTCSANDMGTVCRGLCNI